MDRPNRGPSSHRKDSAWQQSPQAPEEAKVVSKQPCPKHTEPMTWVHISQDSPALLILGSRNDQFMRSGFIFLQVCNG